MEETKTYVFDGASQSNVLASILPYLANKGIDASTLAMMSNGGFGGFGGDNFLALIFLLYFMNNGNWGGNGNGNYVANQLNNETGRQLLSNAIQYNGDAIRQLSSYLNSDFNAVQSAIFGVQSAIQGVSTQVGMSGLQVQNAIQSGDAALASQLAQCCCENRLLTTQQGYEAQIRTLEQTNQLGAQADRNTRSITDAISAQTATMIDQFCQVKERELQDKIDALASQNTVLRGQIDNANQTAQIQGYIGSLIAPLQKEVSEIKASQPNTVPVQWPNLTAVNTTPYVNGGIYAGYGYGYGNGWNNGSYWG